VTQVGAWSSNANTASVYNIMRGACRNVALTCGYAVFAADDAACPRKIPSGGTLGANENTCIESISDVFYQSLLCPENSYYVASANAQPGYDDAGTGANKRFYANQKCLCAKGYGFSGGRCSLCPTGSTFTGDTTQSPSGVLGCQCSNEYELSGGYCRLRTSQ
jgi:hypothetical protein